MNKKYFGVVFILFLLIGLFLIFMFFVNQNRISLPNTNINFVKQICNAACSTNSFLDYCSKLRVVDDGKNPNFEETCYNLATKEKYSKRNYGILVCAKINCSE